MEKLRGSRQNRTPTASPKRIDPQEQHRENTINKCFYDTGTNGNRHETRKQTKKKVTHAAEPKSTPTTSTVLVAVRGGYLKSSRVLSSIRKRYSALEFKYNNPKRVKILDQSPTRLTINLLRLFTHFRSVTPNKCITPYNPGKSTEIIMKSQHYCQLLLSSH